MQKKFFTALSSSILFFSATHFSYAEIDAKKVIDLISARIAENNNAKLKVESFSLSGATITAKNVVFETSVQDMSIAQSPTIDGKTPPPAMKTVTTNIGDVILENVVEEGTGYRIEKVSTPSIKNENFEFRGATMNKVLVAGLDETDFIKKNFPYESIEVGAFKYLFGGAEVFRIESAKATMSPYSVGAPVDYNFSVSGIYADLTKIPDPKTQDVLKTLGYGQLNSTLTGKFSWNPAGGQLTYNTDFMTKDVGTFSVNADVSGYTQEMMNSAKALQNNPQEMLQVFSKLVINSASIRFDDNSFTSRILDFTAKQSGQERAALVTQSKGMVQLLSGSLKNQEFAKTLNDAVGSFLDAPKSLEIKVAPSTPTALSSLQAIKDPEELIKILNLTTTANQ
jgi:hypothetical protein